jgi:hypothetical protein
MLSTTQTTQSLSLRRQFADHRLVALSALLALLATVAVVLVLAIDDGSTQTSASAAHSAEPALRSDGGPEESATAASLGLRPSAGPDESRIAAAISSGAK